MIDFDEYLRIVFQRDPSTMRAKWKRVQRTRFFINQALIETELHD